jgi:NitT/TauT family transport system substrate-binding protein
MAVLSFPVYGQERVVAAYGGTSGQQGPLWVAHDLGIFKKHGIYVEPTLIRGGPTRTAAISSGEVQFGVDAAVSPITSGVAGADILIVATYYNKHPWSFAVRPGIRSSQELPGKRIGVVSLGGSNHMAVITALRHWGIDEKSVSILRAGGTAERLAALQTGRIDATVLIAPETQRARKAGIPILLELGALREGFPTISIVATRKVLANKRDAAKRFLKGISEGVYIFKTDRERSLKVLSKWMRTSDKEVLEDTYQSHASNVSFPPFTDLSGIQAVMDFLGRSRPEIARRSPQEFIEEKILKELEAEGFFDAVQKK